MQVREEQGANVNL